MDKKVKKIRAKVQAEIRKIENIYGSELDEHNFEKGRIKGLIQALAISVEILEGK